MATDITYQTTNEHNGAEGRRTLYRHPSDRRLAGICGGLGDYFDIDPVLIRILFLLAVLGTGGAAILAYGVLWLMLPVGTQARGRRQPAPLALSDDNLRRVALVLIGLGLLWLLANTGILPELWRGFWAVMAVIFWPALLILAGWLLLRRSGGAADMAAGVRARVPGGESIRQSLKASRRRIPLKRSRNDRLLLGVCGGLARAFQVNAAIVRLLWALFSIGSLGAGVLLYVLLAFLLPEEENVARASLHAVEGEILEPLGE